MQTSWEKIKAVINIRGSYDITDIHEKNYTLFITLEDEDNNKIIISFGQGTIYYKKYEEECMLNEQHLLINYFEKEDIFRHVVYLIEGSSLIKEITECSCDFYKKNELLHYFIVTPNHFMDIITYDEIEIIYSTKSVILNGGQNSGLTS